MASSLTVSGINAAYGAVRVLEDVSMAVEPLVGDTEQELVQSITTVVNSIAVILDTLVNATHPCGGLPGITDSGDGCKMYGFPNKYPYSPPPE